MVNGVDLSVFNGNVNFKELKNEGYNFVILRLGYIGNNEVYKDEMFDTYYENAKAQGLKVGVYVYNYCRTKERIIKGCMFIREQLENLDLDLPIYLDMEDNSIEDLGGEILTDLSYCFIYTLKEYGMRGGIYASLNWYKNYLDYNILRPIGSLWIAHWQDDIMLYKGEYDILQYTSEGELPSVESTFTDLNILYNDNLIQNVEDVEKPVDNEIKCLAIDVILGKYGNGHERKDRLKDKYNDVQDLVNKIYYLIKGD